MIFYVTRKLTVIHKNKTDRTIKNHKYEKYDRKQSVRVMNSYELAEEYVENSQLSSNVEYHV